MLSLRHAAALAIAISAAAPLGYAADPLMVLAGDGLTIVVASLSEETGTATGEIRLGGQNLPFRGILDPVAGVVLSGSYSSAGKLVPFRLREVAGSEDVIFVSGGRSVRLRSVDSDALAQSPAARPAPRRQDTPPAARQTKPPPVRPPARAPAGARPQALRLKLHSFPDVTLGNPAAFTLGLPPGWSAAGEVEWSPGATPHPQQKFRISSPNGGVFVTAASIHVSYAETIPFPGGVAQPPTGVPAPRNLPDWFLSVVTKAGKVQNIRLIEANRSPEAEAMWAQYLPGQDNGSIEVWVIVTEYDEAGVRRREEAVLSYHRLPPFVSENFRSQTWAVYPASFVSAPVAQFEALKPQLHAVGASRRPTAKWFVQSQALLADLSRQRIENFAAMARQRAREFDRLSDQQMADYRRRAAASDRAHHATINSIHDRTDYVDSSGSLVNLPSHYRHVYSDGQGNFLLTDNSLDSPGGSWSEIESAK